jgi:branched-chain amino acid transport system substrate-binding protein
MKRLYFFMAMIMSIAIVLAACAPTDTETPSAPAAEPTKPPAVEEEPIIIGASLPLTGMFSIEGQKHKAGYELCVKLINEKGGLLGRPVELLVEDNRSDTEVTVSQYERFINVENVDLLFGPFSSKLTFPGSTVTEQAEMVLPIPSGGALQIWERGFKYIFYFQMKPAEYIGQAAVETLVGYRDLGVISEEDFPKTAAVVHADDFFANAIATGLLGDKVVVAGTDREVDLAPGWLVEAGIEIVFSQQWPEGYTDWLTLANSIKASEADYLLTLTASTEEEIQLVKALQTVGYQPKGLFSSEGTQAEFFENLGSGSDGVMIFSSWDPVVQWEGLLAGEKFTNPDFAAAYKAEYGEDPDEDEAIPFAVCQGMEQAVRGAGTTDNKALREWLTSRTADDPVKTILGDFYWDERGVPIGRNLLMTQWQNGELEFIYPVGEFPGTKEIIWPKPEW